MTLDPAGRLAVCRWCGDTGLLDPATGQLCPARCGAAIQRESTR